MPSDADPVAALLDPELLRRPAGIVASFVSGQDPEPAANALTTLALNVWLARRGLVGGASPQTASALDRLDGEVQAAMRVLRGLTGAREDPDFG
ncbi:MAG: hypothetical protein DI570_13470 [Phenylobacterium zucineum]|nr:MAG: hypothetical protein DI570_13470 [Phenylobacterium zucineum]